MKYKKKLEWGETPWDDLSTEDLLLEVKRMYSALVSLNSVVRMDRVMSDPGHPFYGTDGSGGRALEKARQILEPIDGEPGGKRCEDTYRAFFRYADDLLFDRSTGYRIGSGWAVCPVCGLMLGENMRGDPLFGQRCGDVSPNESCDGVLRALSWEDLKPNKKKEEL